MRIAAQVGATTHLNILCGCETTVHNMGVSLLHERVLLLPVLRRVNQAKGKD